MKNFVIANKDTLVIVHRYEAEAKQLFGGDWGSSEVAHLEVPEELDPETVKLVVNGEEYTLEADPVLVAAKQLKIKEALVTEAFNRLNAEVYAQNALVSGTTNPDSAIAWQETYKNMKSSPSRFSSKGYKAEKAVGAFNVGDALDTDQKITDYASLRLSENLDYSIWRMDRIEAWKAERAAILAGE